MERQRILLVTGKLAESALRSVLAKLRERSEHQFEVEVLGISVAALMHTKWVSRKLTVPDHIQRVILPGWCQGELDTLSEQYQVPFERGPKDLFDLPEYFGQGANTPPDLSEYDIEILAEINHAPKLTRNQLVDQAESFRDSGADVIDLGCIPGETWGEVGDATRILIAEGHRVSIDSFNRTEVEAAVEAGAELVLSCNPSNVEWTSQLNVEVVAIPDDPRNPDSLTDLVQQLDERGCRYRIDPILEPIGFGFAESLARYAEVRRWFPDCEMMMGIGNVTELSEADTAGMNLLLAGICQEWKIHSVLTTEVINWARTAVTEFDLARRLTYHSIHQRVLPKHLNSDLVMLRDVRLRSLSEAELLELSEKLSDANFRIFVENDEIHLMNRGGYWRGSDPYRLLDRVLSDLGEDVLDVRHAFYLGYELAKAVTALTLGKQYRQDQALSWGFLTVPEVSAIERRRAERDEESPS